MNDRLSEVISAAGGRPALAKKLSVTEQAVHKWLRQGWVPPERAKEIEGLFGVPRLELVSPRLRGFVAGAV